MGAAIYAGFILILLICLMSIPILIVLWTIFTEVVGMDRNAKMPPAQTEVSTAEASQTKAAQTSANPRSALVGCFALPCVIAGAWSGGWVTLHVSGVVGGAFGGFLLFCLVGRLFSRSYRKLN